MKHQLTIVSWFTLWLYSELWIYSPLITMNHPPTNPPIHHHHFHQFHSSAQVTTTVSGCRKLMPCTASQRCFGWSWLVRHREGARHNSSVAWFGWFTRLVHLVWMAWSLWLVWCLVGLCLVVFIWLDFVKGLCHIQVLVDRQENNSSFMA